MKLVIVHYHLRPGGIRRIIELAAPPLVADSTLTVTEVTLAAGEAASDAWHQAFARNLDPVPVGVFIEPAFRYLSELRETAAGAVAERIRCALKELLDGGDCMVWMHNPAVGRNLLLAREVADACASRGIPLVAHHHDWWFDNRWRRWSEIRRAGFSSLAAAAKAAFPSSGHPVHVAINQADARILRGRCGERSAWMPNLTVPGPLPSERRISWARRWVEAKLGLEGAPFWLVPCRTLRRKNLAEALLLARWLRPEGWLLVTGGPSSAEEAPYAGALAQAAGEHGWRLRLGILAGAEAGHPKVADLLAACEAVLFTSIQEGFGLPYLEAAAAGRPLIARRLPNIMPDLDRFGFRFPQAYDDLLIAPDLFDWAAERARQARAFREWRALMPASARRCAAAPVLMETLRPRPIAFSRLTLRAQLEVLAKPPAESWAACHPLNPFLIRWRRRVEGNALRATPWPAQAARWVSGEAYARSFHEAMSRASRNPESPVSAADLQADFIRDRLSAPNLYPILWPVPD